MSNDESVPCKGSSKEEEEEEEEGVSTLFRQTDSTAASADDVICRNFKAEVNLFLWEGIFKRTQL